MHNSFFRNLFQFGVSRIFMSADFMFALFITIAIERMTINMTIISIDLEPILNVLVGLFSFVFAALAIMMAFSETGLGKLLTKMGKQKKYIIPLLVFLCGIPDIYSICGILLSHKNRE